MLLVGALGAIYSMKDNEIMKRTGVFVGLHNHGFQQLAGCGFKNQDSIYGATGGALSVAAGRLS